MRILKSQRLIKLASFSVSSKTFNLEIVKNHLLFDGGNGLILVDTGSPLSFHQSGRMVIGDEFFDVPSFIGIVTSEYLRDNIGTDIKGILGMDYLIKHRVEFNIMERQIVFDGPNEGFEEVSSSFNQIPILEMEIDGRIANVFFDTGAPITYLESNLTKGKDVRGRVSDFWPFTGQIVANVYEVDTCISGEHSKIIVGEAPQKLNSLFSCCEISGVIGMDLLKRYSVLLDKKKIFLKKIPYLRGGK